MHYTTKLSFLLIYLCYAAVSENGIVKFSLKFRIQKHHLAFSPYKDYSVLTVRGSTLESDVCIRQTLTSKVVLRTVRV